MATETNGKTDGTQISSMSSIFSDMKTMFDEFRQGLPDYIAQIISKKLDEQDAISLHANLSNIDEDSGSSRVNNNGERDAPVQNDRDKGCRNKDADQGSVIGGTSHKDADSSTGELFRNRKSHSSKDDDEPPLNKQGDTAPS